MIPATWDAKGREGLKFKTSLGNLTRLFSKDSVKARLRLALSMEHSAGLCGALGPTPSVTQIISNKNR